MTLIINGVDIMSYVFHTNGFKWQREDVDGPAAGRMLDGKQRRDRIATKRRLDITCRPLTLAECSIVLTAIMPEWVEVTYTDPQLGRDNTLTMYSNNNPASFLIKRTNDEDDLWDGITFPLIEQ